jgi:hypothetical protein
LFSFFANIETQNAELAFFDDFVEVDAFAIRNEKLLRSDSKFVHVNLRDGSKVAHGEVIAVGYNKKIKYSENLDNLSQEYKKITAEESGFFTTFVDGFEDFDENSDFNCSNLEVSENVFGKLVTSQECKLVCKISKDSAQRLYGKNQLECKLKLNSNPIECRVESFVPEINGNVTLILSTFLNESLLNLRQEKIRIRVQHVVGIKISKSAIRHNENGESGVFIKHHKKLNFKKINILHEDSDFVICEEYNGRNGINVHDQIVISGH